MSGVHGSPLPPAPRPQESESGRSSWGQPPAQAGGRAQLSPSRVVVAFGTVLLLIVIISALAVVFLAPKTPPPDCDPGKVCSGPPASLPPITGNTTARSSASAMLGSTADTVIPTELTLTELLPATSPLPSLPLQTAGTGASLPQPRVGDPSSPTLQTWPVHLAADLDYGVRYPPYLSPNELDGGAVLFDAAINSLGVEVVVRVDAQSASTTPQELMDEMVQSIGGNLSSLAADTGPSTLVHRPSIGHVPAEIQRYRGDLGSAGSVTPVSLIVMGASDGRITVVFSVLVIQPDATLPGTDARWFRVSGEVTDPMLKRFEWTADQ